MTSLQKTIKYLAMAFAILLIVGIFGGILSAVGIFGGLFDKDTTSKDTTTEDITAYAVSDKVTALDIEIGAADFTIKEADAFKVESNLKNLTVTNKGGRLIIKEKSNFGTVYKDAALTLYIPADTVFDKVDINTGAGKLTVGALSANELDLDLGAGEVKIDNLTALIDADIDGGAGKITVNSGSLANLDLDMGVGQLNLTSALLGDSELSLGVGESNLTLVGNKEDYRLDVDKGVGNITVDGQNLSKFSNSTGANRVDIDGGIGAININFKAE